MQALINGFSKLSREEKINALIEQQKLAPEISSTFAEYLHPYKQNLFNDISENTVSNYYLPFSLAPNFLINGRLYMLPMVIEESSVVAAASKAATFWAKNGGFQTKVINTIKNGQIFFSWSGSIDLLNPLKKDLLKLFLEVSNPITKNMRSRGGGIIDFELKSVPNMLGTHQVLLKFKTGDSMGANFINTCLETIAPHFINFINQHKALKKETQAEVIMSILSNYTPECLVECIVRCKIESLQSYSGSFSTYEFAQRFKTAVEIAQNDPYRAVTHNKGIFNGIDAVVLATGNDFRAIEAGAHAYSSNHKHYSSLTSIKLNDTHFEYTLLVPLAMGTVGGLTNTHPLAKAAINMLGNPSASELMQITAAAGMANNFGAVASLITTGIQQGHMKLHLVNVLNTLNATDEEKVKVNKHFKDSVVSFSMVETYLKELRN